MRDHRIHANGLICRTRQGIWGIIVALLCSGCSAPAQSTQSPSRDSAVIQQTRQAIMAAEQTAARGSILPVSTPMPPDASFPPVPTPVPPDAPFPPVPTPVPPDAPFPPVPTSVPPDAPFPSGPTSLSLDDERSSTPVGPAPWLIASPSPHALVAPTPTIDPHPRVVGAIGEAIAGESVTIIVHRIVPWQSQGMLAGWIMDVSVRNDGHAMMRWRLPTRAERLGTVMDAVQIRVGADRESLQPVMVHGDLPAEALTMLAEPSESACLGAWSMAHWDRGSGPDPRWLAPGTGLRALIALDPSAPIMQPGLLTFTLDAHPPLGIALPPAARQSDAPLGWRTPVQPGTESVAPGGIVIRNLVVFPAQSSHAHDADRRPCEAVRRLTWQWHNPTDRPLPPPAMVVLDRGGWRYRPAIDPTLVGPLAPQETRNMTAVIPAVREAKDGSVLMAVQDVQRSNDAMNPWMIVEARDAAQAQP